MKIPGQFYRFHELEIADVFTVLNERYVKLTDKLVMNIQSRTKFELEVDLNCIYTGETDFETIVSHLSKNKEREPKEQG
jgi:hypothetical protein